MRRKDLSLDLSANAPLAEIHFGRDTPLKILTNGNGFHFILQGTTIFTCQSDKFTDVFDPVKNEYIKKLISPYRISYRRGRFEDTLLDFAKESWREEALQVIQKAIDEEQNVVEIPYFYEREWREKWRQKK